MPECRRKVSPASAFLPAVNFFSPASAFWHQGQSGTAGDGLVRHCPALLSTDLPHVFARVSACLCLPTFQVVVLRCILMLERDSDELLRETEQLYIADDNELSPQK